VVVPVQEEETVDKAKLDTVASEEVEAEGAKSEALEDLGAKFD
jgi:hypothetical protein